MKIYDEILAGYDESGKECHVFSELLQTPIY